MRRIEYRVIGEIACLAVVLTVSSICPSAGYAAGREVGTEEQRAACTPDVFRLCGSEIPNVDHILVCMTVKKASLSPACKAVFVPVKATTKDQR
jgi:hypothetical protein